MPLYTLDQLVAYQLSMDLKKQVLELIYNSAAQHAEFAQFVKYSRGSLQEVRTRLPDGIAKRHYTQVDIAEILKLADRLAKVLGGLYFSLLRQAEARRDKRREPKSPDPPSPRPHRPPKPR